MPRMMQELEQHVGPPKRTPLALDARTGQNVDWLDDKPSLRPVCPKRKRVHFRDRLVGSLTVELEFWLTSILADQSQRSQSATLGGTLLAMQLVRRTQFRRRRSKPKRSQAWTTIQTTIRSLPMRRP
jgi:hypothetical protein